MSEDKLKEVLQNNIPDLFVPECLKESRIESFIVDCLNGTSLESFLEQTISFSMVRHPFER